MHRKRRLPKPSTEITAILALFMFTPDVVYWLEEALEIDHHHPGLPAAEVLGRGATLLTFLYGLLSIRPSRGKFRAAISLALTGTSAMIGVSYLTSVLDD